MLPEKFPIGLVQANQDAQIDVAWIPLQITVAIVRAEPDLARRNDCVAVGLAAERADPLDVLGFRRLPLARLAIEIAGSPFGHNAFGDRRIIAKRCTAPLV